MKSDFGRAACSRPAILAVLLLLADSAFAASVVSWDRSNDGLACKVQDQTIWRFSYATNQGKPFFHPLSSLGGESLTTFKPGDHPWHYGLWFSWKYINGINFWEEDKKTGKAQGTTQWDAPEITTRHDGSADIHLTLKYLSPTNTIWMTERRHIHVSALDKDGGVTLNWIANFTAGDDALFLDRTHMPGEEHGAVNGGYAGRSARLAQAPAQCQFLTIDGPVDHFESDRARPNSSAAACNIAQNGHTNGIAIFSKDSNSGGKAPWYIINAPAMRWFSPALLAPAPKHVRARESFTWSFRVVTKTDPWTSEKLRALSAEYNRQ